MSTRLKIHGTRFSVERQSFMATLTAFVDSPTPGAPPEAKPDFTEIDLALTGAMTEANIFEQCMTFAIKAVASTDSALLGKFGVLYP